MALPNELHPLQLSAGSAAAYEIEQSLRFDGSSRLTRTHSCSQTRTFSFWNKYAFDNVNRYLYFHGDGSYYLGTRSGGSPAFNSWQTLNQGSSFTNIYRSDVKFRDPAAWYHFVFKCTSSDVILYINGEQWGNAGGANIALSSKLFEIGSRGNAEFFSGYQAEWHFVDNQALDPTSFGEYDDNGVWRPIEYTGSYGTNGFYLKFDPSATNGIGHDHSGNGNNFTPTGFDTTTYDSDVVIDTPTKNFATLNPLIGHDPNGLQKPIRANGNLQTTSGLDQYNNGRIDSTTLIRPIAAGGTFKYEFKLLNQLNHAVGWMVWDPVNWGSEIGSNAPGWISTRTSPSGGGTQTAYTSSGTVAQNDYTDLALNDIVTVTIDLDNSTASWYVNGTRKGHMTGCNFSDYEYITIYMREATRTQASGTMNCNFGQKAFQYTGVSGDAWGDLSTLPAPDIKDGSDYFNTVLYTGNQTARDITVADNSGNAWQPDFVWLKSRAGTSGSAHHILFDAVRGANNGLYSSLDYAEAAFTQTLTSFNSDGFSLGTDADFGGSNWSSTTYAAWNWNAGENAGKTYTVKVVSDSGNKYRFDDFGTSAVTLSLAEGATYIFDQSDSSNSGHPLRFSTTSDGTHGAGSEYTTGVTVTGTPGQAGAKTTIVVAASAPTLYYYCSVHSGMGGQVDTTTTLGSSNFDGSIQSVVKSNPSAGFSIVSFTGTGSQETIGHNLGVAPSFVILKNRDNSSSSPLVYHSALGLSHTTYPNWLYLNGTFPEQISVNAANHPFYQRPNSSFLYFNTATSELLNISGEKVIAYCFAEIEGYSKFTAFNGNNNSDGSFIYCGFKPAWLLIKGTNSAYWYLWDDKRSTYNAATKVLLPSDATGEQDNTTRSIDFLSNGFKLRTNDININANGQQYIVAAFASNPFGGSGVSPATAR